MTRTTTILAAAAVSVIVGLGVLSGLCPAFKAAATDVGMVTLAVMVLSGLLGALIAPLLDLWTDDRFDDVAPAASEPLCESTPPGLAADTGVVR